ncbi:MAG: hypothetical protein U9Q74_11680 [Gemmatimonadota bacterium]|nr:hypothetical protein [Gemmatimonadota bacterium]
MRRVSPFLALAAIAASLPAAACSQGLPPVSEQVAAAVLPLPKEMQAGATVMGYKAKGKLEVIRQGNNGMICLALYVTRPDFHVACYHQGLEAFMARGRALRDKGIANVDSVRFKEIADGTLKMPKAGALYEINAKGQSGWDPKTGKLTGGTPMAVIYMPYATTEETGLSSVPVPNGPWLMLPGTAKAHVMLVGSMAP